MEKQTISEDPGFLTETGCKSSYVFGVVASRSARALHMLNVNVIGVCIKFGGVGGNNVLPSAYLGDATLLILDLFFFST